MPPLRAPNARQTSLPHDARESSPLELPSSRPFGHRRNRPTTNPTCRSSRRLRAARRSADVQHSAPNCPSQGRVEGVGSRAEAMQAAAEPLTEACRRLRLEGADEMQDLIASVVLSECVYKKLELDERDVAAKVSEFLSCFPPGWVQLDSLQVTLSGIPQHYLVATSPTTMYVAFMGTKQFQDILVDANLLHTPIWAESARLAVDQQSIPAAHRGFLDRARSIQVEQLYELAVSRGLRLVLCGHSLGGAVAKLCTLRLLRELPDWPRPRVHCISFATPAVGNAALAEMVENAGWASHFATYYLPEDQLVHLISFAQARNSTSTAGGSAGKAAAGASGGAGSRTGNAGSKQAKRKEAKDKVGSSISSSKVRGGRSQGGASLPTLPPSVATDATHASAFPTMPLIHSRVPRVSSSSSVCSTGSGVTCLTNSSSTDRSLGVGRLGTSSSSLSLASTDSLPASASCGDGSGRVSRSSSTGGFPLPPPSPVQLPPASLPDSPFRSLGMSGANAGPLPHAASAVNAAGANRISSGSGSGMSSAAGSFPNVTSSSCFESLDEEQAGAAMEEILAPSAAALAATASVDGDGDMDGGVLKGACSGGSHVAPELESQSSAAGLAAAAAARRMALYGSAGGSWGLRLALERKRVLRRMRRMAIKARIPLPRALLPVSRFHTFGAQWFVTEDGAFSPEELERRQQRQQQQRGHREQQQQAGTEHPEGARGFFSFHRMLAYRQRHLDIISRGLAVEQQPLQQQAGAYPHQRPATATGEAGEDSPAIGEEQHLCAVRLCDDLMPRIAVHHAVLRGMLPNVALHGTGTDGDGDVLGAGADLDGLAAAPFSEGCLHGDAPSQPQPPEPQAFVSSGTERTAAPRRWWPVSRCARGGVAPAAAAPVPSAPAKVAASATSATASGGGLPVAQLFRWALSGGGRSRGGVGGAGGGAGGGRDEVVRLDLEVEGQNLQYCRKVSVSLHMHPVVDAAAREEEAAAAGMTSSVAQTAAAGATKQTAHRWGPFPAWSPPSATAAAAAYSGGITPSLLHGHSAPTGTATAAAPSDAAASGTNVPCEVLQVLYAQPYSSASNPPPLHPVSLLRNTLHHLAGNWMQRWQRIKLQAAEGGGGGGGGSANGIPWRRFRFRSQSLQHRSGVGSSGSSISSGSEEEGSDGDVSAAEARQGGVEVPAAAAMPSRLLLKVSLPRSVARGLLDGTLPAHLTVSARSDFHAVSAVPVAVQRHRVAIVGTSPYAASLVQATLAAPSAMAAAAADLEEQASARRTGLSGGRGAAAAAAWLPLPLAWAFSAVRGGGTAAAMGAHASSDAAPTSPTAGMETAAPRKRGLASAAMQLKLLSGNYFTRGSGAFRGRRRRAQVPSPSPSSPPSSAPDLALPTVAAVPPETAPQPSLSVPAVPLPSQYPAEGVSIAAEAAEGPRGAMAEARLTSGHSTRRHASPPLPERWVVRLTAGVPRWRVGSGQFQWGLRQSLAAAAVGVAAAAGGVSAAAAAVAAAAVIVSALGTAAASGSDGGTAFLGGAAVSVAAAAAAAAAAASAMAGGEAAIVATIAAVAAAAAVGAAAAAGGTTAAHLIPLSKTHGSHPAVTAMETATSANSTAAAGSSQPGSQHFAHSLSAPSPGPNASMPPVRSGLGADALTSPSATAILATTGAPRGSAAQPSFRTPLATRPTPQAPRWVLRFGAKAPAAAGPTASGAAGLGNMGRPVVRGWSLWLRGGPAMASANASAVGSDSVGGGSESAGSARQQQQQQPPPPLPPPRYGWLPWMRPAARAGAATARVRMSTSGAAAATATATAPSRASSAGAAAAAAVKPLTAAYAHSGPVTVAAASTSSATSMQTPPAVQPLQQFARRLFPPKSAERPIPLPSPSLPAATTTASAAAAKQPVAAEAAAASGLRPQRLPLAQLRSQLLGSFQRSSGRGALPLPPTVVSEGVELWNVLVEESHSAWPRFVRPGAAAATAAATATAAASGASASLQQHLPHVEPPLPLAPSAVPAARLWPMPTSPAVAMPAATATSTAAAAAATAAAAAAVSAPGAVAGRRGRVVDVAPFVAMRRVSEGLRRQVLQRGWWWKWLLGGVVGVLLRPVAMMGLLGKLPMLWGMQALRRGSNRHAAPLGNGSTATTSLPEPQPLLPATTTTTPSAVAPGPSPASSGDLRHACDWGAVVVAASCRDPLRALRTKDMEQLRACASEAACPLVPVLLTCADTPPVRRVAALRALAAACGVEPAAVRVVWLEAGLLHRSAAAIPEADMAEVWRGTVACGGAAALRSAVWRALRAAAVTEGQQQTTQLGQEQQL